MNSSVRFSITCLLPAFLLFARLASAHPWASSARHPNNCSINEHPDVVKSSQLDNSRTNLTYSRIQTDLNGVNYLRHVHSARLSSGHNYRYVHYRPYNSSKPSILFLHGFPSSSYDWRRQYDYFASRGYGILAPDLLGYGGSDKPSNVEAYTLKNQANDIAELLDCAGIGDVMSVAHDL